MKINTLAGSSGFSLGLCHHGDTDLGDQVDERLSSELLDPLCVETGQVVELSLPLRLTAAIESPILYNKNRNCHYLIQWSAGGVKQGKHDRKCYRSLKLRKERGSHFCINKDSSLSQLQRGNSLEIQTLRLIFMIFT